MNKKLIKISLRHNSIYPFQYLIWTLLRDVETTLISYFFNLGYLLIYTPLMFFGEFLAGLIFYLYQKKFLSKNKIGVLSKFLTDNFMKTEEKFVKDSKGKIIFLLITSALCDFVQFLVLSQTSKFIIISDSIEQRLRGIYTINYALFYYYILRLPIFRHHIFSLVIIGICVFIIIITEFIFQEYNIFLSIGDFILVFVFIFIAIFFSTLLESIEKYLFEYDQLNPFFVLMLEGIFGFILTSIYCVFQAPFDDIIIFKKNNTIYKFIILIFCLILYVILSGGKNSFRVITTKIYNPMTSSFMEYIFNPFYLIYYYITETDFISYGKSNFGYFFINLIISLIVSFCGGIFNEFIVLICYGLESDTYSQVRKRAKTDYKFFELMGKEDDEEQNESLEYTIPKANTNSTSE